MPDILSVQDFAGKIKAKYPEYKDMDDLDLATKIVAKHPEYKDKVSFGNPTPKEYQNFGVKTAPEPVSNAPVTDQGTPLNSELPQDHYPGFTNQDAKNTIYGNVPGTTKIGDTNVTNNAFNQNMIDSTFPVSDNQKQLDQTQQEFAPTAQIQANTANKTTNPATVVPQGVNPVSAAPVSLDKGNQSVDDNLQGVHVEGAPGTYESEKPQRYGIEQAIDDVEGSNPSPLKKVLGAIGTDASKAILNFGAGALDLAGSAFGFANNLPAYLTFTQVPEKTEVQKTLQDTASNLKELTQSNGNKDALQLFKESDYIGATRKTAQDVVQGLPIMIASMGTGGLAGATMFGADAFQDKYDDLRESNVSETMKRTNALFTGIASGGTLALATGPWTKGIAPKVSELIDKFGADKAKSVLATKTLQLFSNLASKSEVLNTPVFLGLQSGADRFATNAIDNATGVKSGNLMEGVGQSIISGFSTGVFFKGKELLDKIPDVKVVKNKYDQSETDLISHLVDKGFSDGEVQGTMSLLKNANTTQDRSQVLTELAKRLNPDKQVSVDDKGNVIIFDKTKGLIKDDSELGSIISNYSNSFDNYKTVSSKFKKQTKKESDLLKQELANNPIQSSEQPQQDPKQLALQQFNETVAKKQQDIETQIAKQVNPDTGNYTTANVHGIPSQIIGGKVVFKEDGNVDTENSDKKIVYLDDKGEKQITSLDNMGVRIEDLPSDQAIDQAKQGVTAPLQAKFDNSQVRPYNPGESATIDFKDGTYDFGQIQGVNPDGTYQFVGSRGPQNIEPRSIVNEDNLQGINTGDLVNYTDQDGQLKQGVYQFDPTNKDDLLLRTQGNVFINDQAIPVKNVQPKKTEEPTQNEQNVTPEPSQDNKVSIGNQKADIERRRNEELFQHGEGELAKGHEYIDDEKAAIIKQKMSDIREADGSVSDENLEEFRNLRKELNDLSFHVLLPSAIREIKEKYDAELAVLEQPQQKVDTSEEVKPVEETPVTFKSQIPVTEVKDKSGKVTGSTTLYEQAPVETTIGALKESFDPETVPEVVGTTIKNTQAQIDKLNKTKLKGNIDEMAQQNAIKKQSLQKLNESLDYWNKVNEALKPKEEVQPVENPTMPTKQVEKHIKEVKPVVVQEKKLKIPRNKKLPFVPKKIQNTLNRSGDPRDLRELIMYKLMAGTKLKWDDVATDKKRTKGVGSQFNNSLGEKKPRSNGLYGYLETDRYQGLTPEQLAHTIWENNAMEPGVFEDMPLYGKDTQDILNVINDVIKDYPTTGQMALDIEEERLKPTKEEEAQIDIAKNNEIVDNLDDEMYEAALGLTNFTPEQLNNMDQFFAGWSSEIANHETNEGAEGASEEDSPEIVENRPDKENEGSQPDEVTPQSIEITKLESEKQQLKTSRDKLIKEIASRNGLFGDTKSDPNDLFGGESSIDVNSASKKLDELSARSKEIDRQIADLKNSEATGVKESKGQQKIAPGQDKEPGEGSKGNEVNKVDKEEKPLTNSMDDFGFKDEDITKAKKKCIPRPKGGVFADKTDFSIKKK